MSYTVNINGHTDEDMSDHVQALADVVKEMPGVTYAAFQDNKDSVNLLELENGEEFVQEPNRPSEQTSEE